MAFTYLKCVTELSVRFHTSKDHITLKSHMRRPQPAASMCFHLPGLYNYYNIILCFILMDTKCRGNADGEQVKVR